MLFGNSETSDCIDSLKCLHISILFSRMLGIHVVFAKIRTMHLIFYTKKYLCILKVVLYIYKNCKYKNFYNFWRDSVIIIKKEALPAGIHHPKVKNENTRARCKRRRSGVFIVNFEDFLHFILVFILLTVNM